MKRPAFAIACALLAGGIVGRNLFLPEWAGYTLGGAVFALALAAFGMAYFPRKREIPPWQKTAAPEQSPRAFSNAKINLLVIVAFFTLAFLQQNALVRRENLAADQIALLSALGPQTYRGTVADEPLVAQGNDRVTLPLRDVVWVGPTTGTVTAKVSKAAMLRMAKSETSARQVLPLPPQLLAGNVQISVSGEAAKALLKQLPFQGQRVECAMMLHEPPPPAHIGLFDYQAYLREHGICAMGSVWTARSLRLVAEEDAPLERAFYSRVMPWRRDTLQFLKTLGPSDKTGLMQAILLGDMGGITPKQRDAYARSGVAHLLAVSGTHTALIALIIFMFCRLLQIPPRASAVVVITLVALYTVLTGFLPPVTRSAAMVFFVALPLLTRRVVDSLTAFSLAAALTLLLDPAAYLKPDFQLSYLCVFGMIVLAPALTEIVSVRFHAQAHQSHRLLSFFSQHFLQPLAQASGAQLMVLPVLAIFFHQFPLIGFLSNLILVPYFGFYLVAVGAVALIGTLNPALAQAFGPMLCEMSWAFDAMAEGFASIPGACMPMLTFPWWLIAGYYALLLTGPHLMMRDAPGAREARRGKLLLRLTAVVALLAWWPFLDKLVGLQVKSRNEFALTMLDVGQGDSLVLETDDNEIMMIDTGKAQSVRVILDYLKSRGIEEIAALALTHADSDHSGGAQQLIERFPVRQLLVGPNAEATSNMQPIIAAARQHGVWVTHVARGDVVHAAHAQLQVLNPSEGARAPIRKGGYTSDSNSRSLVFRLDYGDAHFLLMGDAGLDVETELLRVYGSEFLAAQVLKVGHHGSASASGAPFVNAAHPQLALFSAGRDNSFGHPTPQVVERIKQANAQALTTAEIGSVDVRTDGKRLWWRTSR